VPSKATVWYLSTLAAGRITQVSKPMLGSGAAGKAKAKADVVLSDMAANATGHRQTDHLRIMALAEAAADFAREVLAPGGSFLCKVLQGGTEARLLAELKREHVAALIGLCRAQIEFAGLVLDFAPTLRDRALVERSLAKVQRLQEKLGLLIARSQGLTADQTAALQILLKGLQIRLTTMQGGG